MTALAGSYEARRKDGALVLHPLGAGVSIRKDGLLAVASATGLAQPVSEGAARALLGMEGDKIILMAGRAETVASVFRRFLAAQPPVVTFGETAPAGGDLGGFTQYEHTFLSERLGVDPAKVAALMESEQKEKTHAH